MTFNTLREFYQDNYSIGFINASNGRSAIENRFVLIGLICWLVEHQKQKNPDVTYYEIVRKLNKNACLPDNIVKGLAIICEDFAYASKEFPTFGLKGKDILKEIDALLKTYLPF